MKKVLFAVLALAATLFAQEGIERVSAITQVFSEGQKLTAAAVKFSEPIGASSLSLNSFKVKDRNISKIYTNDEPRPSAKPKSGKFVIIELDPKDAAAQLFIKAGNVKEAKIVLEQTEPIRALGGKMYPPATALENNETINLIVDDFKQFEFYDLATGVTLKYNLFIPKNYDASKKYPMVLFMHDAGPLSEDAKTTLLQGNGGTVWANEADQAEHPSFVLAPQYSVQVVNDESEATPELEATVALVKHLTQIYAIDGNRIYATGQSMGGMMTIAMNAKYPNLFAASYLVACQWDPSVTASMAKNKIFILVSQGDKKAFPGMNAITQVLAKNGGKVARAQVNGEDNTDKLNAAVRNLTAKGVNINYMSITAGTIPDLPAGNPGSEHVYTWKKLAYNIKAVREWIFSQSLEASEREEQALKAAAKGSLKAMEQLSNLYLFEKKEYEKALFWSQKAADKGSARAEANLGAIYLNGYGASRDYAKAKRLLKSSSARGDMKAPRYLGEIYEQGLGVKQDYKKAAEFYALGAKRDDLTSQYRLGKLYEQGLGVAQSYQKAMSLYLKANGRFDHVTAPAFSAIGDLYANGLGVEKNQKEAQIWYEKAAKSLENDKQSR